MNLLRQYVGGPKNRYKDEKFNLDLTYITPRLIAMAFPASGFQKLYRNPIETVKQFLNEHHGTDYMIVNLSGREVDQTVLKNVYTFDWEDHQAPPLEMLFDICNKMSEFLKTVEDGVVAVNCNHGKGRTGTVVCCFLLYCSMFKDSQITMDFYAKKRFEIQQGYGVTQPCQIQYIKYFQKILLNPKIRPRIIALTKVIFRGSTKYDILYVKAKQFSGKNIVTTKKSQTNTFFYKTKNEKNVQQLVLTLSEQRYFLGDCKIFVKNPSTLGSNTVATYSFNTAFLEGQNHIINVHELSPYSLRKSDSFGKQFQIQLQFKNYCKCPPEIQSERCKNCKKVLSKQQQKWKIIESIVQKRQHIQQRQRESMLGYHIKNGQLQQKNVVNSPQGLQIELGIKEQGNKN